MWEYVTSIWKCHVHTVHIFTMTMSSTICTLRYINHLGRVSTPTCFGTFRHRGTMLRESLWQRYISQHVKLRSAPPCRNDCSLKMLKCVKLIAVNYSIMILTIKIRNVRPTKLPVLSCFYICEGCIQTSALILYDLKRSSPDTPCAVYVCGTMRCSVV